MPVKLAAAESLRHRFRRVKVHHVRRANGHYLRHPALRGGRESIRPGREHPADQFVGQFGRGDVEHPREHAVIDQRLHRQPACAGGVEHQHFVASFLEHLPCSVDTRSGHAKHGGCDQRTIVLARNIARQAHETGHGPHRLVEHRSRHSVEPGDIHNGVEHQNVFGAHVVAHLA